MTKRHRHTDGPGLIVTGTYSPPREGETREDRLRNRQQGPRPRSRHHPSLGSLILVSIVAGSLAAIFIAGLFS